MTDLLLLALTAGMSWGMWRGLGEWGAGVEAWLWAWGIWIAREMRAM